LEYWEPKLKANRERDQKNLYTLEEQGWQVLVVWQCEIRAVENLTEKLFSFLGPPVKSASKPPCAEA
jgi:DNA mismatch endonuclease, patch repair protein